MSAAADALKAAVSDAETIDGGVTKNARIIRFAIGSSPEMSRHTTEIVKKLADVVEAYTSEHGAPPACAAIAASALGISALQMSGLDQSEALALFVALARATAT